MVLHFSSLFQTSQADILIVAIGNPEFVRGSWVKCGVVVIDCGINAVEGNLLYDVNV